MWQETQGQVVRPRVTGPYLLLWARIHLWLLHWSLLEDKSFKWVLDCLKKWSSVMWESTRVDLCTDRHPAPGNAWDLYDCGSKCVAFWVRCTTSRHTQVPTLITDSSTLSFAANSFTTSKPGRLFFSKASSRTERWDGVKSVRGLRVYSIFSAEGIDKDLYSSNIHMERTKSCITIIPKCECHAWPDLGARAWPKMVTCGIPLLCLSR